MVQLLRALVDLPEDVDLIPSNCMVAHSCLQFQYRGSNSLPNYPQALDQASMCCTLTHADKHSYT